MPVEGRRGQGMLEVAYVLQNVGGARFDRDVGDTVPVKHSILGLRQLGHHVTCFKLADKSVLKMDGQLDPAQAISTSTGIANRSLFLLIESVIRRIQRELGLPYYALIDSFRFYHAARQFLPHYDLCHEYHGLFSVGASLACRRLGVPYVLSVPADQILERDLKGTPVRGLQGWLAKKELELAFDAAQRIICVSEPARRRLVKSWGVEAEKIAVMPNGVDLNLFSTPRDPLKGRRRLGLDGAPTVMFVGAFQVWHGLDRLVEAFRRLKVRLPRARLVFVGDGPARPDLEKWIHNAGLEGSALITGYVPQREVPELLSAADIAVLPYPKFEEEMWFSPLKLFEYMAAGKAIVASRAGQIPEVIEDGVTGVLVEPGDVSELEDAISDLLVDAGRRAKLGFAARKQALKRHSWEEYAQDLETLYREVLLSHRARYERHG